MRDHPSESDDIQTDMDTTQQIEQHILETVTTLMMSLPVLGSVEQLVAERPHIVDFPTAIVVDLRHISHSSTQVAVPVILRARSTSSFPYDRVVITRHHRSCMTLQLATARLLQLIVEF